MAGATILSFEGTLQCVPGLVADGDLSAAQFKFVTYSAAGKVELNSVSGGIVAGVLQNKPKDGEAAVVAFSGVTKIVAGTGGIAPGTPVMSDTDGTAIAATAELYAAGLPVNEAAEDAIGCIQLCGTYLPAA